jgi:hypothetical protein
MEAIIRKQQERALTKNKASAFRVRKRPVTQEKINRYIYEHPRQFDSNNEDLDVEMNMASASMITLGMLRSTMLTRSV